MSGPADTQRATRSADAVDAGRGAVSIVDQGIHFLTCRLRRKLSGIGIFHCLTVGFCGENQSGVRGKVSVSIYFFLDDAI